MKKSLISGCAVFCLLTSTVSFASETADSIKESFTDFLSTQTQLGEIFDLNQVTVIPDGQDFNLTLPAVNKENLQIPERTVHLTYAGEFNGQSQYKIESIFENIQALLKDLLPEATFTTSEAVSNTIWVPHYNLISNNSQKIKDLNISVPDLFTFTLGEAVSDTLVHSTGENKMDRSDSQDVSDIRISNDSFSVLIPSLSYQDDIIGSVISGNGLTQVLSSQQATYQFKIPAVLVNQVGLTDSLGSVAFNMDGTYHDDVINLNITMDKIALNSDIRQMIPTPQLIPAEVNLNVDISGLNKNDLQKLYDMGNQTEKSDEVQAEMQKLANEVVLKINRLEAKNADGGVAVTGTVATKVENDIPSPDIDLTVTITNLDKLSPPPAVNQAQCDEAQAQLNAINPNDADVESRRMVAEYVMRQACEPQGGQLDSIRPFIDADKRVTNSDGSTTDTIAVRVENDSLTINGQPIDRVFAQ